VGGSWSAGTDVGAAITDYGVEYSVNDLDWTTFTHTASAETSIVLSGLDRSSSYRFRISAVNDVGIGRRVEYPNRENISQVSSGGGHTCA
ncbi:MAG: fibronectin type III domain-containing protein, partial [Chitinophagia bacterium]